MKKIPISSVKEMSKQFGYDQLIVFGWSREDNITSIATYGKTVSDCDQAAQGGNCIKKLLLKWPDNKCYAEPNRVKKLKQEIKLLKEQLRPYENK